MAFTHTHRWKYQIIHFVSFHFIYVFLCLFLCPFFWIRSKYIFFSSVISCSSIQLHVWVIAWFVVIFGINTTSDISKLFYIISRPVRRVKFWGNFEISRVLFMPYITYNSCFYLFILLPGKFSHLTPCVYFRRVVSLRRFWINVWMSDWMSDLLITLYRSP